VNIVSLDTSTRLLGVGVLGSNGELASGRFDDGGHSSPLFGRIDGVLHEADVAKDAVDLLAIVSGPGSFTGLRIGMSGLMGWAEAATPPLHPVDSFRAMRVSIPETGFPALITIHSRAEEFYYQIAGSPEDFSEPFVGPVETAREQAGTGMVVVGPGADRFTKLQGSDSEFSRCAPELEACDMISVCREAKKMYDCDGSLADSRRVEPFYMTLSQAQINFEKRERRI
jgi:tRNA threonylcarbamoyladenosine biosynthesis protein TsaB